MLLSFLVSGSRQHAVVDSGVLNLKPTLIQNEYHPEMRLTGVNSV